LVDAKAPLLFGARRDRIVYNLTSRAATRAGGGRDQLLRSQAIWSIPAISDFRQRDPKTVPADLRDRKSPTTSNLYRRPRPDPAGPAAHPPRHRSSSDWLKSQARSPHRVRVRREPGGRQGRAWPK
jgi:hypothetical protein